MTRDAQYYADKILEFAKVMGVTFKGRVEPRVAALAFEAWLQDERDQRLAALSAENAAKRFEAERMLMRERVYAEAAAQKESAGQMLSSMMGQLAGKSPPSDIPFLPRDIAAPDVETAIDLCCVTTPAAQTGMGGATETSPRLHGDEDASTETVGMVPVPTPEGIPKPAPTRRSKKKDDF